MPSKWGAGISGGAGVVPKVQVTVANASAIIDALAIVDGLVGSVGLNKLAATTTTQGTAIFTGDAIFSRGTGLPLIDLSSAGMSLFSTASAGSGGGNTAAPYVSITSGQVALFSGGNPSVVLTSSSVTLYSVNGSTGSPYVTLSSSGITVSDGSGAHQVTVNSSGVTITGGVLTSPSVTITGGSFTVNLDTTNAVKITGGGTTTLLQSLSAFGVVSGLVCYNTTGSSDAVLIAPGTINLVTNISGGVNRVLISDGGSGGGFVHLYDAAGTSQVALSANSGLQLFNGDVVVSVGHVNSFGGYFASGVAGISATKTVYDGSTTHTVTITQGIITGWT
jgi:hypothetical protein